MRANRRKKPINLKTFFRFYPPCAAPPPNAPIYRRDRSTPSPGIPAIESCPTALPTSHCGCPQPVSCGSGSSAALRMMSSSRFQRAILRSMRLCPMTDGLNPAEMKIAVGFSPCRYRLMQSIWNSLAYVILLSVTASIDGNVRRYSISALLNCRFVIFAPCKSPFDRPYR